MSKKIATKAKSVAAKSKTVKKVVTTAVKKAVTTIKKLNPNDITKPFGKSQLVTTISEMVSMSKKEAGMAIDALLEVLSLHLKKKGPGEFTLPGIAKFRVVNKPAVKSRKGTNPFTGEPMVFAAKPARNVVKIRPLKKLKDIAK